MAPRGRPPKRTSRMDAAIDAMAPLGFTEEVVLAKMRHLLKEYGGQDGYGFIELDAYRVLLDSLLADQEQVTQGETSKAKEITEGEKRSFIDIPICPSTSLTGPPPPLPPPPPPPVVEAVLPLPPVQPENAQPRRRKPCHGWSSDVDEEWHFITLPSSFNRSISPPTQPVELELTGGRKNKPKRRSRWDLMPEDM